LKELIAETGPERMEVIGAVASFLERKMNTG